MPTHYPSIRRHLQSGDIVLFRGGGAIARWSDTEETHAGKLVIVQHDNDNTTCLLGEFREFKGGRLVTLSSQITNYPGLLDVYRPKCSKLVRESSAKWMCRKAGHGYSYRNIWHAIKRRSNVARLFGYKPSRDMTPTKWSEPMHCSQAVVVCDRLAAKEWGVDWYPCDGVPDSQIEPQHIAQDRRSYELLFPGLTYREWIAA